MIAATTEPSPATLPVGNLPSSRLLSALAPDLAAHHRVNGPLPMPDPERLLAEVRASGLTGRGGAAFPTWRKLATVRAGGAGVVIANGAEGEPASAKDRVLQSRAPHLVLDGLQLAAAVARADRVIAYVPAGPARDAITRAVDERRRGGWDRLPVELLTAPDTFVAGQESAVVAAVEGRRALPWDVPGLVAERGVQGRPTLVQNVETLAGIGLIARHGAAWFRSAGTRAEPGTFLATLSGAVAVPGVYEAGYGVRLRALLAAAGGPVGPPRAVLVGGYHGAWLPASALDVPMSRAGLAPYGANPGAGVVHVVPASVCGLVAAAEIAEYLAGQSAAQCGPCVHGLPAMAGTLRRIAHGDRDPRLPRQVDQLAGLVERRGACHHPDGTARFARSTTRVFADEIALHAHGRCSAVPAGGGTR